MPTLSFHAPAPLAKKIRAAARRRHIPVSRYLKESAARELAGKTASFGEAVRQYAGIVRSGVGDLSTREGFGD